MYELDRSLSKHALEPSPRRRTGKNSGSARKRFAALRATAGNYVGNDILRALLAEQNIHCNFFTLSIAVRIAATAKLASMADELELRARC